MYIEYFDKFYGMTPYLYIDKEEWSYIKKTYEREDVKESLAKVCMTYDLPYADISEEDARKEYLKLKFASPISCIIVYFSSISDNLFILLFNKLYISICFSISL